MKNILKKIKYKFNKITSFWCAKDHLEVLKTYRLFELEKALKVSKLNFNERYNILDFGFGDGFQSTYFKSKKFDVSAIDVEKKKNLIDSDINFLVYDGKKIPFQNKTFDIIFSSNVLEHVSNLDEIQSELFRILKDNGTCIHILPSSYWRFWTIITSLIKYWYIDPRPHGEITSNCFKELALFSKNFWVDNFEKNNFQVKKVFKTKLFYTGNNLFGSKINIFYRIFLAKILGSSCNIFIIKKNIKLN